MNLLNYFNELKTKCTNITTKNFELPSYNIVNLGGQIVYIEGQKGLLKFSKDEISCKLNNGYVEVKGSDIYIKEITQSTLVIQGKKIYKIEVF